MKFVVKCTQTWIEATKMGKNKYMKETTQLAYYVTYSILMIEWRKFYLVCAPFVGIFPLLCEKAPALDNEDHRVEFNNNNGKQTQL